MAGPFLVPFLRHTQRNSIQLRAYSYREVQQILQRGDDADYLPQAPDNADEARPVIPAHRNIRGAAYFAQNNNHKENNNGNK